MKKILLCCALALIGMFGCGGGDDAPVNTVDNSRLSGNWSFVSMMEGSFIVVRGTATFDGSGNGTYTELENSTGTRDSGPFTYSATTTDTVTIDQMVGTLSNTGDFFVLTDTEADGAIMTMMAIKQPTAATNALLDGTYMTGFFANDNTSWTTSNTGIASLSMSSGVGAWTEVQPSPGGGPSPFGYTTSADGTVVIDDAGVPTDTGEVGTVSADGNLLISADTDDSDVVTADNNIFTALTIKTSTGKTNADLSGTYEVHQFMDDVVGSGTDFLTGRGSVVFDGNALGGGIGTATYTDLANSSGGTAPSGGFGYIVADNGTFILDPAAVAPDYPVYGVMSPDGNVFGAIMVNNGDGTVFSMVGVKK